MLSLKITTKRGYDFYYGLLNDMGFIKPVYNIVKTGSKAPISGYYKPDYILKIKGFTPEDVSLFKIEEIE